MLEKLKDILIKKIQENSVESELTYTDREGNNIKEKVYLKRGKGRLSDWHPVYLPIRNDGSNRWHIPNAFFGGTRNLIKLLIYLAIAGFFFLAIKEAYGNYEVLRNLPCVQSCLMNLG